MVFDYKELGFKCGLEIHQQLEGLKLFCNCKTLNSAEGTENKAQRRLQAVAGEMGDIDIAVSHELSKERKFFYESSSADTCIMEYDEEPPHSMNREAVKTCLQLCKLMNCTIVDEIHTMRKAVIDGSNVTGFQRTALVGRNGWIETSQGRVGIATVLLEEEAAQKIKQAKKYTKYRLDRLGMGMIEIATQAEIKDPDHAKETAERIGLMCRSLPSVKRGIGTIRQDVNVSISKGARVEIKGFQDLRSIPKVIDNEIARQLDLITKGKAVPKEVRKAESDFSTSFLRPMPGAARLYPETDVLPFVPQKESIEVPETIEDAGKRIKARGIDQELAKQIAKKGRTDFFEKVITDHPTLNPAFVAETIISLPKEIRRKHNVDVETISEEQWMTIFRHLASGTLSKTVLSDALVDLCKGTFDIKKYQSVSDEDIEREIKKSIAENPTITDGALMGRIMGAFKGRADGKRVNELVRKLKS